MEALPLFGILERGEGEKGSIATLRESTSPRSGFPASLGIRGASGTAEQCQETRVQGGSKKRQGHHRDQSWV